MNFADFLILGMVVLWGIGAGIYVAKRKRQGKCIGCSGNCAKGKGCTQKCSQPSCQCSDSVLD